jgi:prevent-host-death family protein
MKKTTLGDLGAGDTLTVAAFKTHCLRVMDEVARRRRPVTVTKRAKPIVCLMPIDVVPSTFGGCRRVGFAGGRP